MSTIKACWSQYFSNAQQVELNISGLVSIHSKEGTGFDTVYNRPFVPLYPVIEALISDVPCNIVAPIDTCIAASNSIVSFADAVLQASQLDAGTLPASDNHYVDGAYSQYLAKKTSSSAYALSRYRNIYAQIYNFWQTLDNTLTPDQFVIAVQRLVDQTTKNVDREFFTAPGTYDFLLPGSQFAIDWDTLLVTEPELKGYIGIELNTSI